jgi:DNA replication protein DnaC
MCSRNPSSSSAPELLYRLLCAEAVSQRQKCLDYCLKQARLPWDWKFETFPFQEQPSINKGQINALAGLDFLGRANNIVLTGKIGIAIGILREACLNGLIDQRYNRVSTIITTSLDLTDW